MDIESLNIFVTVAAELSISKAAKRLGRVQSNISTRIQQLETEIGASLFVRVGKRLELSQQGELYLDYAQRIMALEWEARHVVTGGATGGKLTIGSMESTLASRLPSVLAHYHRQFAQTRIDIVSGPSRTILESVKTGRSDCGFAAISTWLDGETFLDELGLEGQAVWQEELVLLLPQDCCVPKDIRQIDIRILAAFKQGCSYRAVAEEFLDIQGSEWQINEISSYHVMIASVVAGRCVAVLPRSVLALTPGSSQLNALSIGTMDTYLVWRKNYSVPAFNHFRACVDEYGSNAC